MNKQELLKRYRNEEDRLIVSKIIDKITMSKVNNRIINTDFLDMHQKNISDYVLMSCKVENYKYFGGYDNAEKQMLIIFPENKKEIFESEKYNYNEVMNVIRIKLPKELLKKYIHKDYLSGIMKLGIKREKCGDILVFENGADIVVSKEISKYLQQGIFTLTRFKKSEVDEIEVKEIRKSEIKKQEMNVVIPSLRLDVIVAELSHTSRSNSNSILNEGKVFVNYENEYRTSRILKEKDIIVIRGKGKFEINKIEGKTIKGKYRVIINHYV